MTLEPKSAFVSLSKCFDHLEAYRKSLDLESLDIDTPIPFVAPRGHELTLCARWPSCALSVACLLSIAHCTFDQFLDPPTSERFKESQHTIALQKSFDLGLQHPDLPHRRIPIRSIDDLTNTVFTTIPIRNTCALTMIDR